MKRTSATGPSSRDDRAKQTRDQEKKPKGPKLELPGPDPVTEQVILATALVDTTARRQLLAAFGSESFFAKGHPDAWDVVGELERRGLAYDPATVRQLSGGKVDTGYLDTLIEQRPKVPPNLAHHVALLRWNRARVETIRGPLGGLVEAMADPTVAPDKAVALARATASSLEGHTSLRYLRDPAALVASAIDSIKKRRDGQAIHPYGLDGFDVYAEGEEKAGRYRMIPGCAPKKMTVVTGVPGSGKTTVTARIAVEQANRQRRTLYGAWEQGSELTLELCASISLRMSREDLSTGAVDDNALALLEAEMNRLSEFIRFFEIPFDRGKAEEGRPRQLNDRHLDVIHEYLAATAPDVAIFDLWRRAMVDLDPDAEEQGLYRQQAMLQETQCHGLLIHQLKAKDVETRADKRPTRDALKGSGAWFEVPDTVIGIHREALWKSIDDNVLQALVLKQRHGVWPLAVEFDWDPDTGWIGNGHGVEYVRPGAKGMIDSFIDGENNPATLAQLRERQREKGGSDGKRRKRLG